MTTRKSVSQTSLRESPSRAAGAGLTAGSAAAAIGATAAT